MDTETTGPATVVSDAAPAPALLRGWKEIAGYLQVSPRSAQRWANDLGLPVHRTGQSRGSVAAYVNELDAWQRSQGGPESAHAAAVAPGDEALAVAGHLLERADGPDLVSLRSRWRVFVLVAGGALLMGVVAWSLGGLPRVAASRESTAAGPGAQAVTSATEGQDGASIVPPGIALAIRTSRGGVQRLTVAHGGRGRVKIAQGIEVALDVSLRGEKLHLTVYDLRRPPAGDGSPRPSGLFVMQRLDPEAKNPVRLELTDGWLEVSWTGLLP